MPPPRRNDVCDKGRMRETNGEKGDRIRTFLIEAAVATQKQKPPPPATHKCLTAKPGDPSQFFKVNSFALTL